MNSTLRLGQSQTLLGPHKAVPLNNPIWVKGTALEGLGLALVVQSEPRFDILCAEVANLQGS